MTPTKILADRIGLNFTDFAIDRQSNNLLLILPMAEYDRFLDNYDTYKIRAAGLGYSNLQVQLEGHRGSRKKYKLGLFDRSF